MRAVSFPRRRPDGLKKKSASRISHSTRTAIAEMTAKRQTVAASKEKKKNNAVDEASRYRRIVFPLLCFFSFFLSKELVSQDSTRAALLLIPQRPRRTRLKFETNAWARRTTRDLNEQDKNHTQTVINWHWAHRRPTVLTNTQKVSFFFSFRFNVFVSLDKLERWNRCLFFNGANKWSSASIVNSIGFFFSTTDYWIAQMWICSHIVVTRDNDVC